MDVHSRCHRYSRRFGCGRLLPARRLSYPDDQNTGKGLPALQTSCCRPAYHVHPFQYGFQLHYIMLSFLGIVTGRSRGINRNQFIKLERITVLWSTLAYQDILTAILNPSPLFISIDLRLSLLISVIVVDTPFYLCRLALLATIALAMASITTNERLPYALSRGWTFYLQMLVIVAEVFLTLAAAYDFTLSRRLGGDPTFYSRDPSGSNALTYSNPSFTDDSSRGVGGGRPVSNGTSSSSGSLSSIISGSSVRSAPNGSSHHKHPVNGSRIHNASHKSSSGRSSPHRIRPSTCHIYGLVDSLNTGGGSEGWGLAGWGGLTRFSRFPIIFLIPETIV